MSETRTTAKNARKSLTKPAKLSKAQARVPIWQRIEERMHDLPAADKASLPRDGAREHDHYLYGTPKKDES